MEQPFDPIAAEYDKWYDSPVWKAILGAEIACIRQACGGRFAGRWLEIGVGTGRFASALGIGEGVDPATRMTEIAARRGVQTYTGQAEDLHFPDGFFDGTLLALAQAVGFGVRRMASTLLWKPDEIPEPAPRVETGIVTGAGFVAINLGMLGGLGPSDNS